MTQRTSNVSFFKTTFLFICILVLGLMSACAEKVSLATADFNHLRLVHAPGQGDVVELANASGKTNGARFGSDKTIHVTIIPVEGTGWVVERSDKHYAIECTVSEKNKCLINADGLKVTGFSMIKLAKETDVDVHQNKSSVGKHRNGRVSKIF